MNKHWSKEDMKEWDNFKLNVKKIAVKRSIELSRLNEAETDRINIRMTISKAL